MGEIFNQEALAALDEHRETEEMPRVTSPKLKLVLGALYCSTGVFSVQLTIR